MEVKEKIKELRDKGIPIYSISRLNTVDNCGWEYWQTYMEHLEQKDNIYSFTGTRIHKCLEEIQNGKQINFSQEIDNMLEEAKMLDIIFPNENIENKWKKDIIQFASTYKKPNYNKVETEKLFLFQLGESYLQGIIDLVIYNEDGTISIRDYKTSSKYSNLELQEKGRQLILYGLAMEQMGYEVKDLAWEMLKYVEISYKLKNGNIRTTIAERGFILEKLKADITKELKALKQYSELDIEMMVDEAAENNSFDNLPSSIKEKYTIVPYICYYDFSPERKIETQLFIEAKINEIEQFEKDKSWWEPKEITPYTSFYCANLCGFRDICQYYQDYLEMQKMFEEEQEDKKIEDDLSNFI